MARADLHEQVCGDGHHEDDRCNDEKVPEEACSRMRAKMLAGFCMVMDLFRRLLVEVDGDAEVDDVGEPDGDSVGSVPLLANSSKKRLKRM